LSGSQRGNSVGTKRRWSGCGEASRSIAISPLAHFHLAEALALLGELDEARAAAQAGLALDPGFNLYRYRVNALGDNPVYLAGRERSCQGMRLAGVPER